MFMQAWGHYGTAWPVVHQQLGVRPDLGRDAADGRAAAAVARADRRRDIRLGDGRLDLVAASRDGALQDDRRSPARPATRLGIGQTLPAARAPAA